tara:strand:+ start:20219 stop:21943 length:1725 start_codon:yes stop_codon:yes gene_type:complete
MFKANENSMFVPTKTISIKPEAQIDYNPSNQNNIRWLIPQHIGFFDPRQTQLKYKLSMSGRGYAKPDSRAGAHSLLRDLRIMDGTGTTELESIQDYNVLTSQWWGYTQNESIAHKRDLFEARSANQNIDNQLLYGTPPVWTGGGAVATTSRVPKTIEVTQPIYSGILGGDRVFPVVATQGLRVQMTLDNLNRSLQNPSVVGIVDESIALNSANVFETSVEMQGAGGASPLAKQEKTAGNLDDTFTVSLKQPSDSSNGNGVNRNAQPFNNNPFDIGDMLYVCKADLSDEVQLGVITAFGVDGSNDLQITFNPNRPIGDALGKAPDGSGTAKDYPVASLVYIKQQDRVNGLTTIATAPASVTASVATKISYSIQDIEMLMLQVQPPPQYIEGMMKQVSSDKGLSMDFRTWTLYRFNLSTTNGLTNQLIPAVQTRAYSILSIPLGITEQNNINKDSFKGLTDGCQNYQYVYGGSLIPDRPINLVRYTQDPQRTDALHIVELEKSLVNAGYGVRNLLRVPNRFLIGRAFSKYGQVMNLAPQDLSLRVEYDGATKEKLYEHFIQSLRRVNISSKGVMVM